MSTSAAASAEIAKVAQTAVTTEELLSGDHLLAGGLHSGLTVFSLAARQIHPHADY